MTCRTRRRKTLTWRTLPRTELFCKEIGETAFAASLFSGFFRLTAAEIPFIIKKKGEGIAMRNRKLALLLSAVFVLLIPPGVFAAKTLLRPKSAAGGYYRDIVDRLEITVDRTAFTFQGGGAMQAELTLTLQKTEADFYALIDAVDVAGLEYDSLELICETPGIDPALPENMLLPVRDGESAPLQWKLLLTFTADAPATLTPVLEVSYTSGLTAETADGRLLQIPLTLTVEK